MEDIPSGGEVMSPLLQRRRGLGRGGLLRVFGRSFHREGLFTSLFPADVAFPIMAFESAFSQVGRWEEAGTYGLATSALLACSHSCAVRHARFPVTHLLDFSSTGDSKTSTLRYRSPAGLVRAKCPVRSGAAFHAESHPTQSKAAQRGSRNQGRIAQRDVAF